MGPLEQEIHMIMQNALTSDLDANQLTIELGKLIRLPARSEGALAPERRATPLRGENDSHS